MSGAVEERLLHGNNDPHVTVSATCVACRCCSVDVDGCVGNCHLDGHTQGSWCERCESDGWLFVDMGGGKIGTVTCPDCNGTGKAP